MPSFACVRSLAAVAAFATAALASEEPDLAGLRGARSLTSSGARPESEGEQPRQGPWGEGAGGGAYSATVVASGSVGTAVDAQLVPDCPNMQRVTFTITDFAPTGTGFPVTSSGEMKVYGCSSGALTAVEGKKGVVLFLHGAGGHADDYANIYPSNVYLPEDYNIVFLQTPRGTATTSSWMSTLEADLNHHWANSQVEDNMNFLSTIVDDVAALYGGHEHVWIAGYSQGAVMTSAVALKGTSKLLGGAFVVAGYPPRPLYTDEGGAKDLPSDWSAADVEDKKKTKIYFYTGEFDSVLPISASFCRFNRVVQKYGLASANYRFWSKTGYCHYEKEPLPDGSECHKQISPNGNEFHALWHLVSGEPDAVAGVVPIEPDSDCTA